MTELGNRRGLVVLASAIIIAVTEAASYAAIAGLNPRIDEPILRKSTILQRQTALIEHTLATANGSREIYDYRIGWRYRAGFTSASDAISIQGLRGRKTYHTEPRSGVFRIAAFGDSFVYGNEVRHTEAWPALLEGLSPNIEVLNYGVGGYGTDQALLRYEAEGRRYHPDVVLIGFTTVDIRRVVNVYRRFLRNQERLAAKPRFELGRRDSLVLIANPIQSPEDWSRYLRSPASIIELGAHDQWYEPAIYKNPLYDVSATVRLVTAVWIRVKRRYLDPERIFSHGVFRESSAAFRIQTGIFQRFEREVREAGAVPVILFLPDRVSVKRVAGGQESVYEPLLDWVKTRGYMYLDAVKSFGAASSGSGLESWFMPGGHYSASGNRVVAEWLATRVDALRHELR